jgi:urea transport system ATP-binding protein
MRETKDTILKVEAVTKYFGGHKAIDNLSLGVRTGELRCIIGPNGSGKTTLFNLITGKLKPNNGKIVFKGENITGLEVAEICRRGIGRKFQVPNIFGEMSVIDNLVLAASGKNKFFTLLTNNSRKSTKAEIEDILERIRLTDKRNEKADSLSHGQRQWLEIGMVLVNKPDLILLDEPTAGMTIQETHQTSEIVRSLSGAVTIIVIEHDLIFVRDIGGDVTVLYRGAILAEDCFEGIACNQLCRDVYLGEDA